MKRLFYIIFLCFIAGSAAAAEPFSFKTGTLTIQTAKGPLSLKVEIADTEAKRERGLQFRKSLAKKSGMLFLFEHAEVVSMWMADTPLSLDMLFIDSNGKITQIAEKMEPESRSIFTSKKPSVAVLELNGGAAKALGIESGDQVQYADFK